MIEFTIVSVVTLVGFCLLAGIVYIGFNGFKSPREWREDD